MSSARKPVLDYEALNRAAWDEFRQISSASASKRKVLDSAGGSTLLPLESECFPDLTRKRVLHLFCGTGEETVSLARLGGVCTGLDFSQEAIHRATQLRCSDSRDIAFVCETLQRFCKKYSNTFDLVFASRGIMCWVSDLTLLASCLSKLLVRPGGKLVLFDDHPTGYLLDNNLLLRPLRSGSVRLVHGFYFEGGHRKGLLQHAEWYWSLSDIVSRLSDVGIQTERVAEYSIHFYRRWPWLVKRGCYFEDPDSRPIPMTFRLQATT